MQLPLSDRIKIGALVALLLGMLLLDRGFANWRNNQLNFPDQNGAFLPPPPDSPPLSFVERHHLAKPMGYTGVGLIGISIVLFGIRLKKPSKAQVSPQPGNAAISGRQEP